MLLAATDPQQFPWQIIAMGSAGLLLMSCAVIGKILTAHVDTRRQRNAAASHPTNI